MDVRAHPWKLILIVRAPTSADTSVPFSSDQGLGMDLRVALATKPKEESDKVKPKQSKISIVKPLQSFAFSFQELESVILLPNGRLWQCQQLSTK